MDQRLRRVRALFLDHVSFGSPPAIVLNLCGILVTLALWPTQRLHFMPVRSVWENAFGFRPYSSGTMRGLSRLLHGDLEGALAFNRLSPVTLTVILGLIVWNLHLWLRGRRSASARGSTSPP